MKRTREKKKKTNPNYQIFKGLFGVCQTFCYLQRISERVRVFVFTLFVTNRNIGAIAMVFSIREISTTARQQHK